MKQTCNEPPNSHACAIHSIEPIVTEGKSLAVDAVVASHEPFSKYVKRFHVRIGCPSLNANPALGPGPDDCPKAVFRTAEDFDALFLLALGAQADAPFSGCTLALVWIRARIHRIALGTNVGVRHLRHGSIAVREVRHADATTLPALQISAPAQQTRRQRLLWTRARDQADLERSAPIARKASSWKQGMPVLQLQI